MQWEKHLMLELAETSFMSSALIMDQDLDPGLEDVVLSLLDKGGENA